METTRLPLILGLAASLLVAGAWLLATGHSDGSPDTSSSTGTLTEADREALAAQPVDPGTTPEAPDPSVDFTDPEAVARAYVVAAYSLVDTDAGRTNRRATWYAAPGTPPHSVGVLVVTPPAPGHRITAVVTDITQVGGEPTDTRRGYVVSYQTLEQPGEAVPSPPRSRYVLVVRQFDGRWLVAADAASSQVGEP